MNCDSTNGFIVKIINFIKKYDALNIFFLSETIVIAIFIFSLNVSYYFKRFCSIKLLNNIFTLKIGKSRCS